MSTLTQDSLERLTPVQLADLALWIFKESKDATEMPYPDGQRGLQAIVEGATPSNQQREAFNALASWIHDNSKRVPSTKPLYKLLAGADFWEEFVKLSHPIADAPVLNLPRFCTKFLGLDLNFPFGVPACAVSPNSDYITAFANSGFDLLTYRTVRSGEFRPHPFPNLAFADGVESPLELKDLEKPIFPRLNPTALDGAKRASLVNSIGVPSMPTEDWTSDIKKSKQALRPGQILIVSVSASTEDLVHDHTCDAKVLSRQFADTASNAVTAGADIIELNFSSPSTKGGLICNDANLAGEIARGVRSVLGSDIRLLVKTTYMEPPNLEALFRSCHTSINGMVAINAVPVHVQISPTDPSPFFPDRNDGNDLAGLSGVGIRGLGLQTVQWLHEMRESVQLSPDDWVIVGVGGVLTPKHYMQYRRAGADAVQSCTGAWFNRDLARETRRRYDRFRKLRHSKAILLSGGLVDHNDRLRKMLDDAGSTNNAKLQS